MMAQLLDGKRFHLIRIKPVADQPDGVFAGSSNTEPGISSHGIEAVKINMPDHHRRDFFSVKKITDGVDQSGRYTVIF